MGYSIKSTLETLELLENAQNQEIRQVCFFALDDRPSNRKPIDLLNDCLSWIDQLSAENNVITLIFARTEIQYASNYRPARFEAPIRPIDKAKELLMEVSKLYINPTFLIAQNLGLKTGDLPAVILFNTENGAGEAKYQNIPIEAFDSFGKLENYLSTLYTSFDSLDNWKIIQFDMDHFRSTCQEIVNKSNPIEVPINNNFLSFDVRKSIKIFISYAAEDREKARFYMQT